MSSSFQLFEAVSFPEIDWIFFGRTALDIVLVYYLIYRILLLVRGTRAGRMLLGLAMIGLFYFVAIRLQLPSLTWILSQFLGSVILVVVVLFQDDLRRGLTKVGLMPGLGRDEIEQTDQAIKAISKASSELASRRIGALIAIQREVGLEEFTENAIELDARVSHQLLVSIFLPTSPIHDGAVVISGDRIVAAGSVLPLTFTAELSYGFGTRHRAALGLSERTDAVVVVVSEETGTISIIREGKVTRDLNESTLYTALHRITVFAAERRNRRYKKMQSWLSKFSGSISSSSSKSGGSASKSGEGR
ncbi:MAG TPA: diadenylate cyclase CdaA [Oligoflexia bacterium]|nr:diadenylate cyclase CdaA [Oligoflexia bacterium]HMP48612.1 diadenylate cyclase CdaA [Oligoflexia bacterium]